MRVTLLLLGTLFTTLACSSDKETVVVPGECADGSVPLDSEATDTGSMVDTAPATDTAIQTDSGPATDTSPATDTGGSSDSSAPSETGADAGPGCAIKTGGNLCTKVPKMVFTGKQVVDAIGDEFCDIVSTELAMKTGKPMPGATPSLLPSKLKARVAWSSAGVHGHFHVDDPDVISLGADQEADRVLFYIGGKTALFGEFLGDRKDKGFFYLQMTPPSSHDLGLPGITGNTPAEARLWFQGHLKDTDSFCQAISAPVVTPIEYAARLVAGGYEMEVFLPWAVLGRAATPSSGDDISIDLGLYDTEDPDVIKPPWTSYSAMLRGQVWLDIKSASEPSCCAGTYYPNCDTRTWCNPTLE
jgi:hypothetical protein